MPLAISQKNADIEQVTKVDYTSLMLEDDNTPEPIQRVTVMSKTSSKFSAQNPKDNNQVRMIPSNLFHKE